MLPVLKLGTLVLKTMSKPVAAWIKSEAGKHPKFRNFIINIAQTNHRITTRMNRRAHSHSTNAEIKPLNEEKAVQAAVDLLGELFVFSVGVAVLIFEVQRNARSEAKKEDIRRQELEAVSQRNEELGKDVELLKQKLHEIEQLAKGKGLSGVFKFKNDPQEGKTAPPAA